ncbi:MAG: penicillin-binding protein 2 [Deltaproteobacteria bacterium]|nr:penicillin-binding protein 2 [Candidatus Zymogenaceae bacterium]
MSRFLLQRPEPSRMIRTGLMGVLAVFLLISLAARLAYLQLYRGEEFRVMSEDNRIRIVKIPAPRGMFFDRNLEIVVDNRPSLDVKVAEEFVDDLNETLGLISSLTGVDEATLRENLEAERRTQPKYRPLTAASDLSRDELAALMTRLWRINGVTVEVRPVRDYVRGPLAPHLFGYLGEISDDELETERYGGYEMGDIIGRRGIEETWDRELRGVDGSLHVEVDSTGRELVVLGETEAVPGNNLVLTIDADLQEFARLQMEENEYAGAVIAMDPRTFEVLALVSAPDFDPSLFARGVTGDEWALLVTDPRHPLENKCISGQYPPGSTFKIFTATAGLEEGVIDDETPLYCPGYFNFGGHSFGCWKAGGHGRIKLHRAIRESCDVFFYKTGDMVGIDRLAFYCSGYGLGTLTGIPLANEKPGLLPSTQWKEEYFGEPWYPGETISCAIGQGYVLVTPIQLLSAFCALANGGTVYTPMVVKEVQSPEGETLTVYEPEKVGTVPISEEHLEMIKRGLYGAVNEPGGTGWRARVEGMNVCGKTGTAQVIAGTMSSAYLPYELRDHAWFVCFAPLEDPEIAVAVLVEHGGFGGTASAPIAGAVVREYFRLTGALSDE